MEILAGGLHRSRRDMNLGNMTDKVQRAGEYSPVPTSTLPTSLP